MVFSQQYVFLYKQSSPDTLIQLICTRNTFDSMMKWIADSNSTHKITTESSYDCIFSLQLSVSKYIKTIF